MPDHDRDAFRDPRSGPAPSGPTSSGRRASSAAEGGRYQDLIDPADADAGQQAMHGVLSVFFDTPQDRDRRASEIIARLQKERGLGRQRRTGWRIALPWHSTTFRWAVKGGGMAAAAGLLVAAGLFWRQPAARADIYADAANAGDAFFYFLRDAAGLFADDVASADAYQKAMVEARRKRDYYRAIFERNPLALDAPIVPLFSSWQGLCCGLRDGGELQAAVAENQAALAFCRAHARDKRVAFWEHILTDCLGNTRAAAGDYDGARQAHLDSLALRQKLPGNERDPHRGDHGYEGHLLNQVMPTYLRLAMLEVGEGRIDSARQWWLRAERVLGDQLATVCELNGIALSPAASVWDRWNAVPAEFRAPRTQTEYAEQEGLAWPPAWRVCEPHDSFVHRMGELLYHDAMLSRLEGDAGAATLALDRAAMLEDWLTAHPGNDEFRLPFLLRLERARLAIIRHDFTAALTQLDAADAYAEAVRGHFQAVEAGTIQSEPIPDVNKLPISPTRRAEQQLLRGIALAGLAASAASADRATQPTELRAQSDQAAMARARSLIDDALAIPRKLANRMPPGDRAGFLRQFEAWNEIAEQAGKPPANSANDSGDRNDDEDSVS